MNQINKLSTPSQNVARFFTAGDYTQNVVHLAAAAVVTAAVGFWVGPLILAGSAAAAGLLVVGGNKLFESVLPKLFRPRDLKASGAAGLEGIIDDLSARTGLTKKPIVYDFELSKEEVTEKKKGSDVSVQPAQLQRVVNAAATGLTKPSVMISSALLQLMSPRETKSVLAHEFGHIGSNHIKLKVLAGWLQATTMFSAMMGVGSAAISQSWLLGGLSVAGTVAVAYVGNKFMPKPEEQTTRDGTIKPKARRTQIAIWAAQETVSIGVLAAANPIPVLTAVAIEHGFFWSANFINKSLSRRHEYQADRGAVALGADPLALATSLRKLTAVMERDEPELASSLNVHKGSFFARIGKRFELLYASHPSTELRCKKLAKMAAKQGRSTEEIEQALTGEIDISALPPKSSLFQESVDKEKGGVSTQKKTGFKNDLVAVKDEFVAVAKGIVGILKQRKEEKKAVALVHKTLRETGKDKEVTVSTSRGEDGGLVINTVSMSGENPIRPNKISNHSLGEERHEI